MDFDKRLQELATQDQPYVQSKREYARILKQLKREGEIGEKRERQKAVKMWQTYIMPLFVAINKHYLKGRGTITLHDTQSIGILTWTDPGLGRCIRIYFGARGILIQGGDRSRARDTRDSEPFKISISDLNDPQWRKEAEDALYHLLTHPEDTLVEWDENPN